MSEAFTTFWANHYPGLVPAGYVLRSQLPLRWVRYHSLPGSKRYAENASEYEILIERANTVAADCLGDGHKCWLVANWYTGASRRDEKRWKKQVEAPFDLQPAFKWKFDPDDADEADHMAFAQGCTWQSGVYDTLIRQIADHAQSHTLWISQETITIFVPYDGGGDLILPSGDAVAGFKRKYAEWLSGHDGGL